MLVYCSSLLRITASLPTCMPLLQAEEQVRGACLADTRAPG